MEKPTNYDYGKEVDALIKIREDAKYNLTKANIGLRDLGTINIIGDRVFAPSNLNIKEYRKCANQEFQWQAVYKDGSVLNQFEEDENETQHSFSDINFDELDFIRWMSNFDTETSNADKKVVVTLSWITGTFSFFNGLVPQEVKEAVFDNKDFVYSTSKKLILKMVKRQSATVSQNPNAPIETTLFNRYLLGYEIDNKKVIICIEPNGYVHLWHDQ